MMMNPYDEYALETALRLKEAAGGDSTLTVMSLGLASSKEIIKKAVAVGADQAFLISDEAFKDVDSTVVAQALSLAVKTLAPEAKVLVFGQMSLDDAASQTGPKVAELLGMPSLSFCKGAELAGETLKVTREGDVGVETHEMNLPAVVCMMKCDYELRGSNIKGVMKANKTEVPVKSAADLGLSGELLKTGTRVSKTWQRPEKQGGKIVNGSDPKAAVSELIGFLKDSKVL
jgi:electron transfer flavoprotein beta subunit